MLTVFVKHTLSEGFKLKVMTYFKHFLSLQTPQLPHVSQQNKGIYLLVRAFAELHLNYYNAL